jgi:hypothetical protein
MKKKRDSYFKNFYVLLLQSFKLDRYFLYSAFFDLLFYLFAIISIYIVGNLFTKLVNALPDISLIDLNIANIEELQQIIAALRHFIYITIAYIVLLILTLFIIYCLFKAIVWSLTIKKRIELKVIPKYALLNLVWLLIWIVLISIYFIIKKNLMIFFILLILLSFVYFNTIFNILFFKTKKNKVFKTIKLALKIGITKFLYLTPPFIISLVILIILSQIYRTTKMLSFQLNFALLILLFILFSSWNKFYMVEAVNQCIK